MTVLSLVLFKRKSCYGLRGGLRPFWRRVLEEVVAHFSGAVLQMSWCCWETREVGVVRFRIVYSWVFRAEGWQASRNHVPK